MGTVPDRIVQVGRENLILGVLPASEAVELLEVGFLQPDDWWKPNDDPAGARRLLSELRGAGGSPDTSSNAVTGAVPTTEPGVSWLDRARHSVTSAAGSIASSVGDVAGRLKSLGSLASQGPSTLSTATNKLLDGYLPQIRNRVQDVMGSQAVATIKSGVRDDALMRKVFGAVYDCLPRPICRFVSEERFTDFCFARRGWLVGNDARPLSETGGGSANAGGSGANPASGSAGNSASSE